MEKVTNSERFNCYLGISTMEKLKEISEMRKQNLSESIRELINSEYFRLFRK